MEKLGADAKVLAVLCMESDANPSTTPVIVEVKDPSMRMRDVALRLRLHLSSVEPHEFLAKMYGREQWIGEKGTNNGSQISSAVKFAKGDDPNVYTMRYRKVRSAGAGTPY